MPTNDFEVFGTGVGANVIDQAAYLAASWRTAGFLAGLAQSAQLNKVWRQSSFVTSVLAGLVATTLDEDVLDNGDAAAFTTQLQQALGILAGARSVRVVTASTDPVITLLDYRIGFNRTAGVAATPVALPNPGTNFGQSFKLIDLVGNFNSAPVTVTPPSGTIAGLANFVCDESLGSYEFCFCEAGLWSVET